METIHNLPENMVEEMLEGYVRANAELLTRIEGTKSVLVKNKRDKVMVLAGGGAGCEPMYLGYAGIGMADVVVNGNVFAAPPATAILKTISQMYHSKGVLMVTGNYV